MRKFSKIIIAIIVFACGASATLALDLSLGRSVDLSNPDKWEKWLPAVSNPSSNAQVFKVGSGLCFRIPQGEKEMTWKYSLRPVWLDFHHYMTIKYTASGISSSPPFALIRVCINLDSWNTVQNSAGILADNAEHIKTIDLRSMTSALQVSGIQIHLVANAATTATLVINQIDFTDVPPGFEYPVAAPMPPAPVGFELNLSQTSSWKARPEWLSAPNASQNYSLAYTGKSLLLSVNDGSKGMKWTNNLIGNHNTETYNYILIKYRCRNIRASATDYAVWLSGAGEARPFYQSDLKDDGAWHWDAAPIAIPSVSLMALQVQSDAAGMAFLEIAALRFTQGNPLTDISYFISLDEGWDNLTGGTEGFEMLDLEGIFNAKADQLLPRMSMNVPWFDREEISAEGKVPFKIKKTNPNIAVTEFTKNSSLDISIGKPASEIYLLLAANLPARENPGNDAIIDVVDETERFYAEVLYSDGSRENYFPVDISSGKHIIRNRTFTPLAFPANPAKVIDAIKMCDLSDGGYFALAALTLNITGTRFYGDAFVIPPAMHIAAISEPPYLAPQIVSTTNTLILENTFSKMTFDISNGLVFSTWISHYNGHNILEKSADHRLFSGTINQTPFVSENFRVANLQVSRSAKLSTATLELELNGYEGIIGATLTASVNDSRETQFALTFSNNGDSSHSLELRFPDLPALTLAPNSDIHYAYPRITFLCSNENVDIEEQYSGRFPVQFMDIYEPAEGWGLYLLVKDLDLIWKYFRLKKDAAGASLAVRYPTLSSVGFPAHSSMEIAPFSLGVHAGDWHEAMDAYRAWVSTWYAPKTPRQKWFQEIYTCRRDYPVFGSGYLFDRIRNQYTFETEILNAAEYMNTPDFIDISSWGWSATYGRIGDYRRYELGGLDNFRSGIAYSQSKGIPVGLYIEGYGLDDRATIYQAHGEEWKYINSNGQESRNGHEVIICPHVTAWQDYLRELYADVANETNADAMYIDVFGTGQTFFCHSPNHGHLVGESPLRGEYRTTRKIRESLNSVRSGIPIYTEYTPVDFISQYQDGSFSYTIYYGDNQTCPTETNLFRFCFPDFKQIELVNGQFLARNWTAEGLKKAFFNGEGIWIKGDLGSWYDAQIIEFYKKSHELFQENSDAFTNNALRPFVKTLAGDVFAHQFGNEDKMIFTFYNANWRDVDGDLLQIGALSDAHVVDLWNERMLKTVASQPDFKIQTSLFPRDIGCVGVFKKKMDVRAEKGVLFINIADKYTSAVLSLTGILDGERIVQTYPSLSSFLTIELHPLFPHIPDKLLVKLKKDRLVLDEVILENLNESSHAEVLTWTSY
ncbi:MAG TPA: DUF6259 domain-containing protein [Candidatus Sumerlaeota bacterium]|nr:MAG: hypothetical protein BWY12_01116 [candidate division BRC1 bacterium ADurb.Bin183]HOE63963.1 DUF6259 domain-containing protein [Candidatus Sumerlaeota bacterium]HRR31781.1 DUF6259 domain-containing protein [Candidatus Sumerlaeia bacterium]HON50789.1 DUF6259 domain-containing protein [Candidatus Sumerlaeota bacterium]HOR65483.1 DUF6259 domain-containing protein [Candidatus Sumerlaeota bacterium]